MIVLDDRASKDGEDSAFVAGAKSELARALGNRLRHQPVESDRGKDQRQHAEPSKQRPERARSSEAWCRCFGIPIRNGPVRSRVKSDRQYSACEDEQDFD